MDRKLEEGSFGVNNKDVCILRNVWITLKDIWTGSGVTALPIFKLLVTLLLAFDFILTTQILLYIPQVAETYEKCSPKVLNPSRIEYRSDHSFYSQLRAADLPPPPVFQDEHTRLCDEDAWLTAQYSYCLPISGRKDTPFCTNADRKDLLDLHYSKPVCYASVLHMLLVDVYDELRATGNIPFLTFGSLLGAFRSGSMIPFTEDVDIGYVNELITPDRLKLALRRKGYHMFLFGIWRVCVAPTHPLAARLYDASLPLSKNFSVPYVDLYGMKRTEYGDWDLQELEGSYGSILPDSKVWPFSQVMINGMAFDTLRDPEFFLTDAYGDDFMIPKPRIEDASGGPAEERL